MDDPQDEKYELYEGGGGVCVQTMERDREKDEAGKNIIPDSSGCSHCLCKESSMTYSYWWLTS